MKWRDRNWAPAIFGLWVAVIIGAFVWQIVITRVLERWRAHEPIRPIVIQTESIKQVPPPLRPSESWPEPHATAAIAKSQARVEEAPPDPALTIVAAEPKAKPKKKAKRRKAAKPAAPTLIGGQP